MQKKFKIWMILLLLVVLAVFTIVRTKIVHYSSLAYFPITFLGSYTVYKILNNHLGNYRWLNLLYLMVGIVYGVLLTAAPFVMQHKDRLIASGLIDDDFAIGNLQARVVWTGWESLAGIVFVLGIGVFVFLLSISKTRAYQAVFLNGLVMNCLFILIFIPKVEGYTQHALISFCKDRQKEDCYVLTLGMKSYAHLFYTRKREGNGFRDVEQLIHGQIDKPAYFITRNNNYRKYLEQYPQLHLYKQKNGYVFLKRDIR